MTNKNLLIVRALTAMNEFDKLKSFMQGLIAGDTPQKANIQGFSILVQYFVKNVSLSQALTSLQHIDQIVVQKTEQLMETDPNAIEQQPILKCLLAYYLFIEGKLEKLLQLLNKTKDPEYLALRLITLLKLNRPDLAEMTLKQLKS